MDNAAGAQIYFAVKPSTLHPSQVFEVLVNFRQHIIEVLFGHELTVYFWF